MGHIEFLNCLPIYWGLARTGTIVEMDLHRDTPDRLNERLVSGDLDVGPISLVEYLRHADELRLIPDIAVAADGGVLSVNLVTKEPVDRLPEKPRIALTSTSRTGVALAQLLLEQRHGYKPSYERVRPLSDAERAAASRPALDLSASLAEADGAVVIGDEALRVYHSPGDLHVTDLALAWKEWTGHAMVFAVWAARADYYEANPGNVARLHSAFKESIAVSRKEIETVAETAARWEPFDARALAEYYDHLQFSLSPAHLRGLLEFSARAEGYTGVAPLTSPLFIGGTSGEGLNPGAGESGGTGSGSGGAHAVDPSRTDSGTAGSAASRAPVPVVEQDRPENRPEGETP